MLLLRTDHSQCICNYSVISNNNKLGTLSLDSVLTVHLYSKKAEWDAQACRPCLLYRMWHHPSRASLQTTVLVGNGRPLLWTLMCLLNYHFQCMCQGVKSRPGWLSKAAKPIAITVAGFLEVLIRDKNQEVDGVVGSDTTALDEAVRHGRHDVLHEIVAQRRRLRFQQLLLLPLHVLQTLSLHNHDHPLTRFVEQLEQKKFQDCSRILNCTRAVQPVATGRQLPYLHKPAIVIVTSLAPWRPPLRTYVRTNVQTPYHV